VSNITMMAFIAESPGWTLGRANAFARPNLI